MTRRGPVRADGSRPLPVPDEETVRRFCEGEDGEERLCLHCRNHVPDTGKKGDRAYCGRRCKRAAANARHRGYHRDWMRRRRARRTA
jgi:hypothetical protein